MSNDPRAWRIAALPPLAVLGIALPLTFAAHCDQYLYDFRTIELVPLYATAWLVLAVVAIPFWFLLTLVLGGLKAIPGTPGRISGRSLGALLVILAAAIAVAALIRTLRTWLATFGSALPLSADAALTIAVLVGVLAAATASGRAAVRAVAAVAAICALAGLLSLVSLPVFGWPTDATPPPSQSPLPAVSPDLTPMGAAGPRLQQTLAILPVTGRHRPNILLLTIDALSARHMSLYGYSRPTTPHLAQFARGAVVFDRAYANANFTTPGIATILTGTLPWTNRALQLPVWPLESMRRTSLPAMLDRAGYRMGYVSTNAHAGASKQGFGQYFQFASTDRVGDAGLCSDGLSRHLRYICAAAELPPLEELQDLIADFRAPSHNLEHDPQLAITPALAWLAQVDRSRPIFLWVHLFPPHSPYAAPPPWLGRFDSSPEDRTAAATHPDWAWQQSRLSGAQVHLLEARYDEGVAYVDAYAGPFLERALELLGPNTAVVVTADHGESFAHGYGAHTGPGLYDEIIHIPLILKLPGETAGRRCNVPVEQADIAPTLAQLAQIPPPPDWVGRSLVGVCNSSSGETPIDPDDPQAHNPQPGNGAPARAIFSMNFEQNPRFAALTTGSVAVIDGPWKLIHYMGHLHYPYMPVLHDELYDVVTDPDERDNLAIGHPRMVQRLRGLIEAALRRQGQPIRPGMTPAAGAATQLQ